MQLRHGKHALAQSVMQGSFAHGAITLAVLAVNSNVHIFGSLLSHVQGPSIDMIGLSGRTLLLTSKLSSLFGSLRYQTTIDETLNPVGYYTRSRVPPFDWH